MSQRTPGYRAILITDAAFDRLKQLWREGDDRDANALARLATILLQAALDQPQLHPAARLAAKQLHLAERTRELACAVPKSESCT